VPSLSLSDFITHHHRELIEKFESFARSFSAVSVHMTAAELQDHSEELLTAIVADMDTPQTDLQQSDKSLGIGLVRAMEASGRLHADARIRHRFNLRQVMAEFRALRASVLALYAADGGPADLAGIRRFNEAVDEALTVSILRFSDHLDTYRDQFVGVLGHDLRTPLGAITVGAGMLSAQLDNDPQTSKRVGGLILRSAQRMDAMIADLLDLTRSRLGGGIPINPAPADLGDICAQALVEVRLIHPDRTLDYHASGDLRGAWDAARLVQVVTNLVINALEHGGGTPVTVTVSGRGDIVVLSVHNFGTPIPRDVCATIFEPLVQHGEPTRLDRGLGLGLFIVRGIVRAHGGTVAVESDDSSGTTFEVRLPRIAGTNAGAVSG